MENMHDALMAVLNVQGHLRAFLVWKLVKTLKLRVMSKTNTSYDVQERFGDDRKVVGQQRHNGEDDLHIDATHQEVPRNRGWLTAVRDQSHLLSKCHRILRTYRRRCSRMKLASRPRFVSGWLMRVFWANANQTMCGLVLRRLGRVSTISLPMV